MIGQQRRRQLTGRATVVERRARRGHVRGEVAAVPERAAPPHPACVLAASSRANARTSSSSSKRPSPLWRRTRLASSSSSSCAPTGPPTTASSAGGVNPPRNTRGAAQHLPRVRRRAGHSSSGSSPAASAGGRGGRAARARRSTTASASCSAIWAGLSEPEREAASSIASGSPSSARQISATVRAIVSVDLELAVCGQRALHEQLHRGAVGDRRSLSPSGSASGSTSNMCSPRIRNAVRLEISTRILGASGEQLGDQQPRPEQVLEVVDDHQQLPLAQVRRQAVGARAVRSRRAVQARRRSPPRPAPDRSAAPAARTPRRRRSPAPAPGELHQQARLPDPARPGQRDHPHIRVGQQPSSAASSARVRRASSTGCGKLDERSGAAPRARAGSVAGGCESSDPAPGSAAATA